MKYLLFAVAACMVFLQCSKSTFDDLSGSATLKGIAMVYDTLSGLTSSTPLKNAKVFIRYADNPGAFLYSTTSNAAGEYRFGGLNLDKSYVIYASVDTGLVKYEGELPYPANFTDGKFDTLKLFPSGRNQNGIHLIAQDSVGGRLSNVTVWVFNSPVLFALDTSAGKVFDMVTNSYGTANRYNIAPGKYYFRVKTKIGNLDLTAEDSVVVASTGIAPITLTLRNKPLTRNGVELMIFDVFNTPVNGSVSHFYRSRSVFLADTIAYNQSIFTLTSNAAGSASAYFIDSARYYFRTIKVINTDTLKAVDSVDVRGSGIMRKSVVVQ